jgi:chromosome segregation ATPase
MDWLKSKTAIAGGLLALVGLQGYSIVSVRGTLDERIGALKEEMQVMQSQDSTKMSQLSAALDVVTEKMGITAQELQQAHSLAAQLKQENARANQATQRLRTELSTKADAKAVNEFREEATTKLMEVQQDATTKIGAVTGEVQVVRTDLNTTREELANSRKDIMNAANDITQVRSEIARNAGELAELRRRGERDYIEFEMGKTKQFARVADIGIQLKKTDVKKQKYTVMIQAGDEAFEKKDRTANEPVTFLVGRDRLRYEFVVNSVDKDRIRGYLSTPKDRMLSAEGPSGRRLQ